MQFDAGCFLLLMQVASYHNLMSTHYFDKNLNTTAQHYGTQLLQLDGTQL